MGDCTESDGAGESACFAMSFQHCFGVEPAVVARAPGRIEVIGNHTDYNGGSVLGGAINFSLRLGIAPAADGYLHLASGMAEERIRLAPDAAGRRLEGAASWANYVLGCQLELRREFGVELEPWMIFVDSDLPAGAGLSSSAALELAALYAFARWADVAIDPARFARMARRAENDFVGMPCGILDQGTIAHGRRDSLVLIDCAEERFSTLAAPIRPHFHLFNSRKKHSLVDSLYSVRHSECAAATEALQRGDPTVRNLATASIEAVDAIRAAVGDTVWKRARHVVEENQRVRAAVTAFAEGDFEGLGQLLSASHRSSRDLFENSCEELDALVEQLIAEPEVCGARLTGGGFGGAVLALCKAPLSEAAIRRVSESFAARFGHQPDSLPVTLEEGVGVTGC